MIGIIFGIGDFDFFWDNTCFIFVIHFFDNERLTFVQVKKDLADLLPRIGILIGIGDFNFVFVFFGTNRASFLS